MFGGRNFRDAIVFPVTPPALPAPIQSTAMRCLPGKMLSIVTLAWSVLFALGVAIAQDAPESPGCYDVVWDSPSTGSNGSMPLGNGEVGLNLWVEKDGDLLFYVSRTDAWSECNQLLKLGRVRLSISPNPFVAGTPFRQHLHLRDGCVEIRAGGVAFKIFVDSEMPVVYVSGSSSKPIRVKASLELWRSQRRDLKPEGPNHIFYNAGSWAMRGAHLGPKDVEAWESADVVDAGPADAVAWYHRNAYSIVPFTIKHQGLEPVAKATYDPLENRTFGGWMSAADFIKEGERALRSSGEVKQFELKLAAHAAQTSTVDVWLRQARSLLEKAPSASEAAKRTADFWNKFWDRSWIIAEDETGLARLGEAYTLQRWINACGGRGNYPIKFNGSIFTVDAKHTGKPEKFGPDWRDWGDGYWWQNTRLPYQPMPACGDFDLMKPLFKFYADAAPLCKARAELYYQAKGLYIPETLTTFGTYSNGDYGWDRTNRQPKDVLCPAWQYCWQQGLELVGIMLDYYDYTEDDAFLAQELLPMAHDVLDYFDSRFPRDASGRIELKPTQVLETYHQDALDARGRTVRLSEEVVNDTPTVAGLHSVVTRLLDLPAGKLPHSERAKWETLKKILPPLPMIVKEGKQSILPAQKYPRPAHNIENGELYAVSPFRLFRIGAPNLDIGRTTYQRRLFLGVMGWSYDGQCAALLGMTDEAKRQMQLKISNSHGNHRFPAMWGPNIDWLPDQTHGGNLMLTLQYMLLQADRDKIFLLPAWPKEWNANFKLRAPLNTVVECVYRKGKIEMLKVSPKYREDDVVLPDGIVKDYASADAVATE